MVVLGASFDTPQENKAFADAQRFGFRLLSDPDRVAGQAYHAAKEADEPASGFARRIAYLIDPAGVVRRSYEVTDVAGFADQVLGDMGELSTGS